MLIEYLETVIDSGTNMVVYGTKFIIYAVELVNVIVELFIPPASPMGAETFISSFASSTLSVVSP